MKASHVALVALVSAVLVPVPSPAEPPPHAKAHGWRKKNDPNYVGYTGHKWEKDRSEEHTSELQSQSNLVCRLLLEKKKPIQSNLPESRLQDHQCSVRLCAWVLYPT